MTAVLSTLLLKESALGFQALVAQACALAGLVIIYGSAARLDVHAALGVSLLVMATFIHSLSSVLIKRIDAPMPALASVGGSMLYALPAYGLCWGLGDGVWPAHIGRAAGWSIVYLGVVATTAGFTLYYYVLRHLRVTQVSLINFITPVFALAAGAIFNHEALTPRIITGAGLIALGLLLLEAPSAAAKQAA